MTVEKDTGTTTENAIMEVKDADTLAKKENTKKAKPDERAKAEKAVKLAVSKYIEELLEKEGTQAQIVKKLYDIDNEISKNIVYKEHSFKKCLEKWSQKEAEPSLYHLCLLTQVHHVSYDYILGLDEKISADQLTYGDTLDFFSYLFRAGKIEVLRCEDDDLFTPASTVASKGYFDMTRFFRFTDETLLDIFRELNQQRQIYMKEITTEAGIKGHCSSLFLNTKIQHWFQKTVGLVQINMMLHRCQITSKINLLRKYIMTYQMICWIGSSHCLKNTEKKLRKNLPKMQASLKVHLVVGSRVKEDSVQAVCI